MSHFKQKFVRQWYMFLYKRHEMQLRVVNVKMHDLTNLLMFKIFFQHFFVQILSKLANFV